MRMAVDIERTHTADTLAAIVVECDGLLSFLYEGLVEDIECLKEGGVGSSLDVVVSHESTIGLCISLTPNAEVDFHYIFFHCLISVLRGFMTCSYGSEP